MTPKTALITGASSGIGKAFALALAGKREYNLILVARDTERLDTVKESVQSIWQALSNGQVDTKIETESVNLASKSARDDLLQRLSRNQPNIDLLVNGAGLAYPGPFGTGDVITNDRMMDVNCAAPVHLCQALLPNMLERRSGSIINVCSTLALAPMPYYSCYSATKAFLLHFSIGLAQEVKSQGVKVLALCPGTTDTPGHRTRHPNAHTSFLGSMTPEKVATLGLNALEKGSFICIPGALNRIVFGMLHRMPVTLAAKIMSMSCSAEHRK